MHFGVIYLFACLVIGFLGRNFRFGFWGNLFCAILLTPVIGLIILLASIPVKAKSCARS